MIQLIGILKGNVIPVIGKVLDGLSIVSDINDSALGTLITSCAGVYGTMADIAIWIYNTNSMQEKLGELNARDAKDYLYDYYYYRELYNKSRDYKYEQKSQKAWEKYKSTKEDFKNNLDKLGIKYYE